MPITKTNGNMYENWVDYCWSPLIGGCLHQCTYCYCKSMLKRFGKEWTDMPHWASDCITENIRDCVRLPKLPIGKIFVCHTTDLFAENVPAEWIESILEHCWQSWCNNNEMSFVIQTKNPARLKEFTYIFERFPDNALMFGITMETNRGTQGISNAPHPMVRISDFRQFIKATGYQSFVTIEPIIDPDTLSFVSQLDALHPDLIWIGADSKRSNLPEPSPEKIVELIKELEQFAEVRLKKNLNRLLPRKRG